MKTLIYSPACLSLITTSLRREPRRPRELQGPHFSEQFDYTTLFYDVCGTGGAIYLSGPPLYETLVGHEICWQIGAADNWLDVEPSLKDSGKCQHSWISKLPSECDGSLLRVSIDGQDLFAAINRSPSHLFAGRRVLLTKSRDNKLEWIRDWVTYHAKCHDVDAVLFYDNNSTLYEASDVLGAIADAGVDVAVVVRWPYKFGPQGGFAAGVKNAPWDSDFCEYGILEHARCVFLSEASMVINTDIDELVMPPDGRSIYQWLEESESGYLFYRGLRIESESLHVDEIPRYYNFCYRRPEASTAPGPTKWTIDPRRARGQWRTHFVLGHTNQNPLSDMFRDFRAISTGWKHPARTERKAHIPADFVVDEVLIAALRRAFPQAYR